MKTSTKALIAAFAALPMLASCGLRGDLERPDPIFSEPAPEEAKIPEASPVYVARQAPVRRGPRFNELGGEIPDAATSTPVNEGGLGEIAG